MTDFERMVRLPLIAAQVTAEADYAGRGAGAEASPSEPPPSSASSSATLAAAAAGRGSRRDGAAEVVFGQVSENLSRLR